ncbi:MAG: ABC transporter ATP-binding protein [Actinomycetota bacterium]|nr:ABC transporter ATP-binding protein [Actinomycetota bacterium]
MTKWFGSVCACDDVDFALRRGEIHGILGENGAGKSTLMRMVIGLVLPDSGTITIDGDPCQILDPLEAAEDGIGMVHQHYSLVDALSVWENVALGEKGPVDRTATRELVLSISERYGLEVDPDARVRDLTAGLRQRVEIIKCLRREPRIIILDEPTAVLTPTESEHLFEVLREGVKNEGWTVALVSHKLDEVIHATDRITIMRDGAVVERVMTADADAPSLARAMVGRPVSLRTEAAALGAAPSTALDDAMDDGDIAESVPLLRVDDVALRAQDGEVLLNGLSLDVHPGEVVGVAGVEGNGQTPLAGVLSSLLPLDAGTVSIEGRRVRTGYAGAMLKAGITVIPADRYQSGCVPEMTVAENLVLSSIGHMARHGVLQRGRIRDRALSLIKDFDIRTPSPDTPLGELSGGNQQRVVLARALSVEPKVLVAHQPTRGLDVGAIEYVGQRLREAAGSGVGVLLMSTDLGEIAALADRIVVIYRGAIIGEMNRNDLDMERLGLLIGGSIEEGSAA